MFDKVYGEAVNNITKGWEDMKATMNKVKVTINEQYIVDATGLKGLNQTILGTFQVSLITYAIGGGAYEIGSDIHNGENFGETLYDTITSVVSTFRYTPLEWRALRFTVVTTIGDKLLEQDPKSESESEQICKPGDDSIRGFLLLV